jgi:hypothetical protein
MNDEIPYKTKNVVVIKQTQSSPVKKFIKDYFGLFPMLGGVLGAGSVYLAAYGTSMAVDAGSTITKELSYLFNYGTLDGIGLKESIASIYSNAKSVSGQWGIGGAVGGQFLFYKFKTSIRKLMYGKR